MKQTNNSKTKKKPTSKSSSKSKTSVSKKKPSPKKTVSKTKAKTSSSKKSVKKSVAKIKEPNHLFDSESLILLISVVAINVLCIIAVSYAYFTAQIKGNDSAQPIEVLMGTMKVKYLDSDAVTLDNAYPGDYLTNKFNIKNEGSLPAAYKIKVNIVTNNFGDKNDLVYSLKKNGTEVVEETTLPVNSDYIYTSESLAKGGTDKYELMVKFKEDMVNRNQNDNKNKTLNFKIEIEEVS